MTNPTIIIINDFAHINGGASQVAISSAIGLSKNGHRVIYFAAVPPITSELLESDVEVICTNQFDILRDPNRFRAVAQGLWNLKAANVFCDTLSSLNRTNTIVHVHSWTKALSSSIVRVAIKKGFKIVCTLHDYFSACPNGGFFNYQTQNICTLHPRSIKCFIEHCDSRSFAQKLWRYTRLLVQDNFGLIPKGIRHFIFVSKFSEAILSQFLPPHAKRYQIDNPIYVSKEEPSLVGENTLFAFVGRLSQEKGPVLFAKAARKIGCQVVFVGDGDCRNKILDILPNVKITGWLPTSEVMIILRSARALVFPSLWYETMGLVVQEAAALGVPAIVADTSSAKDLVINGITGILFQSGNENSLINAIRVLSDSELAKKMGRAAYDKYWSNASTIEKYLAKLEDCYNNILVTE